jgi:hypothetical protein
VSTDQLTVSNLEIRHEFDAYPGLRNGLPEYLECSMIERNTNDATFRISFKYLPTTAQ